MRSTFLVNATARGWMVILGGAMLLIGVWVLSASIVEAVLAGAVAVAMVGFGIMALSERQMRPRYGDLAMWLVGVSVLVLLF